MTAPSNNNIQAVSSLNTTLANLEPESPEAQQVQLRLAGMQQQQLVGNVYSTGGDGMNYSPVLPSSLAYGFQAQNQPPISAMVLDTLVNIGAQMATVTASVLDWAKTLSAQQAARQAEEASGSEESKETNKSDESDETDEADETSNKDKAEEKRHEAELEAIKYLKENFDQVDGNGEGGNDHITESELKRAKERFYSEGKPDVAEVFDSLLSRHKDLAYLDDSVGFFDWRSEKFNDLSKDDISKLYDRLKDGETLDEVADDARGERHQNEWTLNLT